MDLDARWLLLLLPSNALPVTTPLDVPCSQSGCLVLMIEVDLWISWQLIFEAFGERERVRERVNDPHGLRSPHEFLLLMFARVIHLYIEVCSTVCLDLVVQALDLRHFFLLIASFQAASKDSSNPSS